MTRYLCMDIPWDVLARSGAKVEPGDPYNVELHYCPDLNDFDVDGPFFEGTVDGTWEDPWDANLLPREWRERAVEQLRLVNGL